MNDFIEKKFNWIFLKRNVSKLGGNIHSGGKKNA